MADDIINAGDGANTITAGQGANIITGGINADTITALDGLLTGGGVDAASTDWTVIGTGDFSGDGNSDILWRNDDGYVGMWR